MPNNNLDTHMDLPYFLLMKNRGACAKLLETSADELEFVYSSNTAFSYDRRRRDIKVARIGLNGFNPIRRSGDNGASPYSLGIRHIGITKYKCCHNPKLEYLIAVIPGEEEYVINDYLICRKGDLYKINRHNRKATARELEVQPPVLDEQLTRDVLKNTYLFAKNARRMKGSGIRLRRGVVLEGTPGNGKTMICSYIRALCEKDGIHTKTVDSNKIRSAYQNNQLNKLFSCANVIFFDDVDVTFLSRSSGANAEIATSILSAMDGIDHTKDCVVRIFTTNENTDNLDSAFMRPGRIDCRFTLAKPISSLRKTLIESWPQTVRSQIDIPWLIEKTKGMSFAQIENIRSKMVINYYIEGEWNLNKALDAATDTERKVGF